MIKRWLKNLMWLFNHPPTSITQGDHNNTPSCDYCGSKTTTRWNEGGYYCICELCRKKVFDKVLKGD